LGCQIKSAEVLCCWYSVTLLWMFGTWAQYKNKCTGPTWPARSPQLTGQVERKMQRVGNLSWF
jgi:hypothetical protein